MRTYEFLQSGPSLRLSSGEEIIFMGELGRNLNPKYVRETIELLRRDNQIDIGMARVVLNALEGYKPKVEEPRPT